ncbi:MAG: ABC transporter permease [Oscillospiraceae bacterium]|nr:ABC transporter permease [Oscillospiraceae bacterium]
MRPGFWPYLILRLQRVGKLFLPLLLVAALLMTGIGWFGVSLVRQDEAGAQRVEIGVVGDFEDSILRMGMFALRNLDSSRFSIEFVQFSEESEAKSQLRAGKLNGYVKIPEHFVEDVYRGSFQPLTYVTAPGAQGVGTALTDEVIASVSELLSVSEDAVYGAEQYARDHGVMLEEGSAGDVLAMRFLEQILRRDELLQVEILGIGDGLSLSEYFLCSFFVMFLLLWGVSASPVFAGQDMELGRLLKCRGLGSLRQILAEYLSYLCLMLSTVLCLCLILLLILRGLDLGGDIPARLLESGFLLRAVPVGMALGALQILLYECANGMLQGVLLQFLAAVSLGYVCGCLYPVGFFPELLQQIGNILPAGLARQYLSAALSGQSGGWLLLGLAGYGLVFLALSAGIRKHRLAE